MQKEIYVPTCLHGRWNGPKFFCVLKALHEAGIPHDEFDTHWARAAKHANESEKGKARLMDLLTKAGIRGGNRGDKQTRLPKKVWFVNRIVGIKTDEPVPTTTSSSSGRKTVWPHPPLG